jgi:hypothetical protein
VHERSTDPDVVKRLQAETEWAVKARRRYVELTPDDAVALKARITEVSTMLRRKNEEITRLRAVEKAAAALVEVRSGGARTGAGTAQEQAAWNQLGDALNGRDDVNDTVMPWSEAEEARRIAHGLTPWGAPEGPDPELIEVLANAIYACDREPPLNARTVPERWAVYQQQALNIVWPKLREYVSPSPLRAELAEARAEIVRLERELETRTLHLQETQAVRDAFKEASAHWATQFRAIEDKARSAGWTQQWAVVEAAKALVEHLVTVIPPDEDHRVVVQWNSKRNRLELALIDALRGPAEKEDTSDA